VGSVRRERCQGIDGLVEKRASSRDVINVFLGQFDGDALTTFGIDADRRLTPGPAARRAMFFNQPFTGAAGFKTRTVHEEMQRAGRGPAERWQFRRFAAAAHRRMVWHHECELEQPDDGADEPFGLPSGQAKDRRMVGAVPIAKAEQYGWPPGVVRGSARHAAIASSVNQTVKLPRRRDAASYSGQFVTRWRGFGYDGGAWRDAKGTAGFRS
jgi:hypothetical protein